jgi:hypothetical protein
MALFSFGFEFFRSVDVGRAVNQAVFPGLYSADYFATIG